MSRAALLSTMLFCSLAWAQEAADAGSPEAAAQPAVVATPAPAPAPAKAPDWTSYVRVYGTMKPTLAFSGAGVESFSQPNETAITAAGNPILAAAPTLGRFSFQVGQTRFGLQLGEGTPYRGQVEIDFVDFTKATPTVASLPRLRIAKVVWQPVDAFRLEAGQDWDTAQPVNPHGLNMVGAMFQAGNSGYMRQQLKAFYTVGMVELGVTLGMQAPNATSKEGNFELSFTPTVAARAQLNLGPNGKVGISGLATSLEFKAGTVDGARTFAGLAGVYADLTFSKVNVRAEGYVSQNTANLGMLTLSQARISATGSTITDIGEGGGFISVKAAVASFLSVYGQFGGAAVLNPNDVAPSYAYSGTVDPANPPAFSTASVAGTGPGIKWNVAARIGLEVPIWKGLSFALEGFFYRTRHAMAPVDVNRATAIAAALGVETAFIYTF